MPIFSKESLETLKQKIDLVDLLSSHIEMKRSGSSYKGLCPFHDEKTPSFMIQKGDSHYHCFGCGAHGDAIQFLMNHQKLTFVEAIENLAQRFGVFLEVEEPTQQAKGPPKSKLKEALEIAASFYHFCLLHTEEGHQALEYLYKRGIDLDFIHHFRIGLAPKTAGFFRQVMKKKGLEDSVLLHAGLAATNSPGSLRDFFYDRIVFPIQGATGEVIGFSARKYKDDTFGGKYVNTPETPLFKKSKVLFGLPYSRKRIAKERRAIIVEGQIDALRIIHSGLTFCVAGQGTAFGDEHVKELVKLGVSEVYLAFDSDLAGQQATFKVGDLFQKEGVEVKIVLLPSGYDPDLFLRERGTEVFIQLMEASIDYLTFMLRYLSKSLDLSSPAGKTELINQAAKQIRQWKHPVMVHETLRKLSHTMKVPENMLVLGVESGSNIYIKRSASVGEQNVDSDRILEVDLLRSLLSLSKDQEHLVQLVHKHVQPSDFKVSACKTFFELVCRSDYPSDLMSLAMEFPEGQQIIAEISHKKINKGRAEQNVKETLQKMIDRNWMMQREEIKIRIQSGQCSDEEATELAKKFDALKRKQV